MRTPEMTLIFEGKDITRDISKYLLGLTYTDYAHGKADSLEIRLEDRDGIWKSGWFPEKGAKLEPYLEYEGNKVKLGTFEIDEVEASSPPDIIIMRGVSSFISKSFRLEKKSKTWENINLKGIVQEIAQQHGFTIFFDGEDEMLDKISQKEESDLSFLKRICEEHGKNIKVAEEKIIIFEGKRFDVKPSVKSFERGKSGILSFSLRSKATDIYRGAEVCYFDSDKKQEVKYTFLLEDTGIGSILKVNKRAKSLAEAEKLAKNELRKKNRFEVSGELQIVGDITLFAGVNISLSGFGVFDGNYFVEQTTHAVESGYTTSLNIRKVLCY